MTGEASVKAWTISPYHSVWEQEMWNLCTSFSQTLAHENSSNEIRQTQRISFHFAFPPESPAEDRGIR